MKTKSIRTLILHGQRYSTAFAQITLYSSSFISFHQFDICLYYFFYLVHFYPQILNVKLLRHFILGKIVTKPHRIFFVLNGGLVLIVINIGLTIFAFKVQVWYTALFPQCPCLYYASVIPYWHAVIYRPSTNSPDHYPSVASVTSYYIEPTHYIINLFSLLFDQH